MVWEVQVERAQVDKDSIFSCVVTKPCGTKVFVAVNLNRIAIKPLEKD
jgi:hypothetical protein